MCALTPLLTQQVSLCFINTALIVLLNKSAHSEGHVSLEKLPELSIIGNFFMTT